MVRIKLLSIANIFILCSVLTDRQTPISTEAHRSTQNNPSHMLKGKGNRSEAGQTNLDISLFTELL